MYLKALEIQGFKSFPEKTRLSFDKDITVIVGPNGSGKSNISDALLWVMGEQKTRALRGGKMEDVIFGGTEKRGAMGFAQVTLILDNTARIFDWDSDEVSISRKYFRSGESEYYINRESVRLRDVTELLMDTGLGRDGYSIIGQGRIAEIVSAKSTDRREIFEEAAGISRFRHRKDESERKLARTEENLLRIGDKISELEMQVEPLKAQAETAKKYLVLRDELRVQEISLWMETLDQRQAQSEILRRDLEKAQQDCREAEAEQERLYAERDRIAQRMRENDLEAEEQRESLRATEAAAAEAESAAAVLRTNLENNTQSLERLHREISEQNDRAEVLTSQVEEHKRRIESIDAKRLELDLRARELRRQAEENEAGLTEQNKKLAALMSRESELNEQQAENRTALTMLAESLQALYDRDSAAAAEQNAAEEKLEEVEKSLKETRKELSEAKEKEQSLANVIAGHSMLMAGREQKVAELNDRRNKLTVDLRSADSRIGLLSELEREMEGFSKAAKTVMNEAGRGLLRGIRGPLAKLIRTEDRYALAIEIALGAAVGHIVVETQNDAKSAIEMLKKRDAGRSTFLPMDAMRAQRLQRIPEGEPGYLGIAADLVKAEDCYRDLIANQLGRTVVAESLGDAVRMARKFSNAFRIVTLDGQVMNAGGSMSGGSVGKNTGILSRANELERLKSQRVQLEEKLSAAAAALKEAERELEGARYDLDAARDEHAAARQECTRLEGLVSQARLLRQAAEEALENLETERSTGVARQKETARRIEDIRGSIQETEKELESLRNTMAEQSAGAEDFESRRRELEEGVSAIRAEHASLDAEKATVYLAIEQLENHRAQLEGDSGQRKDAMSVIRRHSEGLQTELALREETLRQLRQQADVQQKRISDLTGRKMELEGRRNAADKAAEEKNRNLLERQSTSAMLQQKMVTADMEEKQILDKLWDTYELSRSAAQALRQPVESYSQCSRQVANLRRSISALGNPNLGAIEEYKRVSERYEFLTGQRDDVLKSKNEILRIIADITSQMEEIFLREVQEIDKAFREIFVELFGGGKAALSLEDENDVLNCGIDIRIQPPGKAVSNISLLSGGEKAFVAIALYFAIMRVRPTPFCVMDEIESALDEENVERFAHYMRNMSDKTQFIAITHRRGTMDEADQLYGVTMQEKGVSTVLVMDMEQAMKTIR